MRRLFFLSLTLIFIWSCEWRPDEIQIDGSVTIENINLVVGDTTIIQIEGSQFSRIEGLDNSIIIINEVVSSEHGIELEIIGMATGQLKLIFYYTAPALSDSEPMTASYLIHLHVTESIPLSIDVGEQLQLDFSSFLSSDQLNLLDTVAVAFAVSADGEFSASEVDSTQTWLLLTGVTPGTAGLSILGFDTNRNQIAALTFHIDISIHRTVLAELFTNTGCVNCPEANHYLDNLLEDFADDFGLIRYHVNWTDPFDPMNLYNPVEVEARRAYYNIFAAPGLVLDGTLVTSLDEDDWSGRVFNASQEVTPIYISPIDVLESVDSLHLEFDLNTFGEELIDISVWSVVYEDSIEYSGSNGEDLHMQVMRDMESNSISSLNTLRTIQHSLKKPDDFGTAGPISILIFIQSESDQAVLQARAQKIE